jgi:hypothetical protein
MIRINSQENDLLVTPNHRLLFSYKNAENTHMIKVGELDRLDKKSYMFCSGNNLRESTDVSFDILNMMAYMFNKASVKTASFEFKLETEAIKAASIRDISKQTVPEDFRNERIHQCFRIDK